MKKVFVIFFNFFVLMFSLFAEDFLNNPEYIAQTGYGATKEAAENNALSALSKFFQMSISVSEKEQTTETISGSESTISEEVFIESQTELFAVHYTKPKFNKKQKLYEVIAYINREEAWQIYEPKINATVESFEKFYTDAISQNDKLLKISALSKALDNSNKNELSKKLDFIQILAPAQSEQYIVVRNHLSEIDSLILNLTKQCSIVIDCENDFEECVLRNVGSIFSKIGIKSGDKNSEYYCKIQITENKQILPAGTFFSPSYSIRVEKNKSVLFSFEGQLKKIGAKNETVAQQRAYTSVAQTICDSLQKEFMPL